MGLAVAPGNNTVFATTSKGLFRRAGAEDWQGTEIARPVSSIAGSPLQQGILLVVGDAKRVYRSDDGGASWNDAAP